MLSRCTAVHFFPALVALTLAFSACKKEEEETKTEESATNTSSALTQTSSTIDTVQKNMLPGTLVLGQGTTLDGNPCEGTDGFFDCQPNLLKLYMAIAQQALSIAKEITTNVAQGMSGIAIPSSGTLQDTEDGSLDKIAYDFRSATQYDLLFETNGGVFLDLSVDGGNYVIKVDQGNSPDEPGEGKNEITISYTDDTHFEVTMTGLGMACGDDDVRAPNSLIIKVGRNGDKWQGKAMMRSDRWLVDNNATCATTATDDTKMHFYTDFAGIDDATTAAIYFLPHSVANTDDFASYEASDFCTNYPSMCNGGQAMGDQNPISTYTNPYCVAGSALTWGEACEGVPVTDFSDATEWVLPDAYDALDVELRETLN